MTERVAAYFVKASGVLLLVTAAAKLISSLGTAHALEVDDPLMGIPYRFIFLVGGVLELAVGLMCFSKNVKLASLLVAWLATNFLLYRVGLIMIHYHGFCPCLGSLAGQIHLSTRTYNELMMVVFLYLFVGSYLAAFFLRGVQTQS